MFDPVIYALMKRQMSGGNSSSTGADSSKTIEQKVPKEVWELNHGLNKYPSVTIVDSAGTVVIGDVAYIDKNNVKITFSNAFSGKAFFN